MACSMMSDTDPAAVLAGTEPADDPVVGPHWDPSIAGVSGSEAEGRPAPGPRG